MQDVVTSFLYVELPPISWTPHSQWILLEGCYGEWSHSTVFGRNLIPFFEHDPCQPNVVRLDWLSTFVCKQRVWTSLDQVLLAQPNWGFWHQQPWIIPCDDLCHNFCLPQSILQVEVTSDMINELEEVVGNQHVVQQRLIHRILSRVTLDSSEVKNFCTIRISTKLKSLLVFRACFQMIYPQSNWLVKRSWEAWLEFQIHSPNSIAPSSSRGRVPCLSNAIILFDEGKLWASFGVALKVQHLAMFLMNRNSLRRRRGRRWSRLWLRLCCRFVFFISRMFYDSRLLHNKSSCFCWIIAKNSCLLCQISHEFVNSDPWEWDPSPDRESILISIVGFPWR